MANFSVAPGLLEGFDQAVAPEMTSQPFPINSAVPAVSPGAPPLPQAPQQSRPQGLVGNLSDALVKAIGSGLVAMGGGNPIAIQQAMQEKQRQQVAAQQLQTYTGYLSNAFATGDISIISDAIKKVGNIKDLEPEAAQALSEIPLKMSQQIGQLTQTRNALASLPDDPTNPQLTVAKKLLNSGVDVATVKAITSMIPDPIKQDAFTLRPGENRYIPMADGTFQIVQGPEKPPDSVSINNNDLAAFVATDGALRGKSIPPNMTVPQGRATLTEARKMQQQQINVQAAQFGVRQTSQLRDDFIKLSKPFIEIRDAFNTVNVSAPTAAGDMSMIFAYMKILDPGSTVRESEFANAENAAGVPERTRNIWNKMLTGQRLTPAQRTDFKARARDLYRAQLNTHKRRVKVFRDLAVASGLDPSMVTIGLEIPEEDNQPRLGGSIGRHKTLPPGAKVVK